MRACLVLPIFCCVSCAPSHPRADEFLPDFNRSFAEAESAFEKGIENKGRLLVARKHFSDSTDAYLKLHRSGSVRSPQLYRNLGNAAVLADRWPIAIWAYHVGLKLDPNESHLREQLAFVRGKVTYSPKGQGRPEPD